MQRNNGKAFKKQRNCKLEVIIEEVDSSEADFLESPLPPREATLFMGISALALDSRCGPGVCKRVEVTQSLASLPFFRIDNR